MYADANTLQNGRFVFRQALRQGQLRQAWAGLTGQPRGLRPLTAAADRGHSAGEQVVRLDQIRGTEGRARDFDADFRPLSRHSEERWLRVFAAWKQGKALPPVELIRAGDAYYVRDGHHRISVARLMGQEFIDAVVTVRG